MMSSSLPLTIQETRAALVRGDLSAQDVVKQTLASLDAWESHVHAFLEVFREEALTQARALDESGATRDPSQLLAGIPIAVKDVICTLEGHTTAASQILKNFRSPYDATVIRALKHAGAIIIGKANLDEFAMGSSTEYSAYGPSLNPWDTSRVAGGSSGGSAAAVASGAVLAALGTETGGSIRLPASFCNVVGLKPTYGRVSRFGVMAYGSSFDQVGPLTRTVTDTALILRVMAGHDHFDATSAQEKVPVYEEEFSPKVQGLRIGVPKEFFEGVPQEIATPVLQAIDDLKEAGATVQEISLPLTRAAVSVYYLLVKAEASTNLARYDALRFSPMDLTSTTLAERYKEARGKGFGPEVKRAILMGSYVLSAGYYDAWYRQASKVRSLIREEYAQAFASVDVIAAPCTPEVAFPVGAKASDPVAMYLSDALVAPLNVAGVPAVSVPCGFVGHLPVGLQLVAAPFREDTLLKAAYAYEQRHEWWKKTPSFPR